MTSFYQCGTQAKGLLESSLALSFEHSQRKSQASHPWEGMPHPWHHSCGEPFMCHSQHVSVNGQRPSGLALSGQVDSCNTDVWVTELSKIYCCHYL